ncbi:MAG: DUF1616 domain-containing protein [Candidatus Methanoperedens sp.]|nr:DUF1616 domain-containing protein [Candidatus Methanoperedens sp.]
MLQLPSDLRIVIVITVLSFASVLSPLLEQTAIRTILGIPLVLFLPGYTLIAALFPGKNDLDAIERIALSFGLSIAIVPLIGLVLNFTPWGIRLVPILISLTFFIIVMTLAAQIRRLKLAENMRFEVKFKEMYDSIKTEMFVKPQNRTDKILTIVLVISILASLTMLVYVIVTPKQGEKFTEFYILGTAGKAEGYPTNIAAGKTSAVIVGIVNHEYEPVNYTLQVKINEDILKEQQIQTAHNQTWQQQVNFTPLHAGTSLKLQFLLYRNGNFTQPYRDTHLWVNVTG